MENADQVAAQGDQWDEFLDRYDGMEYSRIIADDGFTKLLADNFDQPDKVRSFLRRMNGPITRTTIEEQRRVEKILEREKEDRAREYLAQAADIEVADGKFVNLQDTVIEPTPEQFSHGNFVTFTPDRDDNHSFDHKAYRRLSVSTVRRMHRKGQVTDDAMAACDWYARLYEESGLEGWVGSVDFGKEVFSAPHDRTVFTERQQEAQSDFRAAREYLPNRFLKFFDAVVVHDLPITRAKRFCRIRANRASAKFRELTEKLVEAHDLIKKS